MAKKEIIDVQKRDDYDQCLRWALRAALFAVDKDRQRTAKYPMNNNSNLSGVDAPTPLSKISCVEKQNKLAINVYGVGGTCFGA